MKKVIAVFGLAACMSVTAFADDWTGYIVDKNCASNKGMLGNEQCAQSCIKKGAKAVLVTDDGKVYAIEEQDKVVPVAGKKVTVTGKIKGDTINVDSVKAM
jgi:hypothetical protein